MIEPEELAFCEVHTDTSQFNTPASPLYSDAFHSGTNPSAVGAHSAEHLRPHPRPESPYLPDSYCSHYSGAPSGQDGLLNDPPSWKYNAFVVHENTKAELARAEARQSTGSNC